MRNTVLQFLQALPASEVDQFNEAFRLYILSPGKSPATERALNAAGYTKETIKTLLYDLQKLHGITDVEVACKPVLEVAQDEPTLLDKLCFKVIGSEDPYIMQSLKLHLEAPDFTYPDSASDELTHFLHVAAGNLRDFFNAFKEEYGTDDHITPEQVAEKLKAELSETAFPEDIQAELELLLKSDTGAETGKGPVTPADETFSLRTQYPFLNDADCPNELKILVADKIRHYNDYRATHDQLQQHTAGTLQLTTEEMTDITKASVDSFKASEAIGAELDYYKEKKELLGLHPIFADLALNREVEKMTQDELLGFVKNTPSYISKQNTALKAAVSENSKAKFQEKIDNRNAKLALVNKKLGVSGS